MNALEGRAVHLLPMETAHVDGLLEAATRDRSTFGYTPIPWDRASMRTYVDKALAKRESGEHEPFVTWSVEEGRIVGSTRFYDLETWDWSVQPARPDSLQRPGGPDVASIGYTWLDPVVQRTPVNTEAKLLMLTHAFEVWGVWRVRIQTDVRNERSRAAIARLGFAFDGALRADKPGADNTVRDSAVYSLLLDEWPAQRDRLTARLGGS